MTDRPDQVIGRRTPLVDGHEKVTGRGTYTDDIQLPGMLVGKILRSPLPHARILAIDTSEAETMPGVRAIVTGSEAPVRFGVLPVSQDETAMAQEKALYVGDAVAGVAADSEEAALRALEAVHVKYEELRAFLTPEESLEAVGEELRIHDKTVEGTNIQKQVEQSFGDVDAALDGSAHVAEGHFKFAGVTHAFTEPHAVAARFDPDGRLTLWSATQVPHYVHRALSRVLGMPMHRIRVVRPMVGGAFGGKSDPFPHEMICALLARKSGRPVKILFDREEVFLTNHGRHPTKTWMRIGCDERGRLTGLDLKALIDGGAWGSFGVVTTYYNGVLCMGPYRIDDFRYRGRRVYTNKPPSGAMRGHGAVNSRFVMEVLIDRLAERCRMDPCDFRLQNLLPENTKTVNEFRITSNGTRECIERARIASDWDARHGRLPYGHGLGLACGFYISGSALPIHWNKLPQSTVHLKIDMDGGITLHSMAAEIGQGSDTMLAQCVAEVLGVDLGWIRVRSRDSDTAPIDLGSYSSRVTFMAGNAARRAALVIREKLVRAASRLTGYPAEGFDTRGGEVIYLPQPTVRVDYLEALEEALAENGALIAKGIYHRAPPMGGRFKGAAAGLSPTYSFQAFVAEVRVDPETGLVDLVKIWAAHDCGRALNPIAVEGQIEGSIHMGLGQALWESFDYNRGSVLNPNLLDYKIPGPAEMPEVEVILVESGDPEGPFGAKECGEGPLLPVLPAVANAIHDAVGIRLSELPMTPERILAAISKAGREAKRPEEVRT